MKLGVLDYAQIDEGRDGRQALSESVELAQHAESLGFHRFWVAEHHNVPAFASSRPEMVMMHLADNTEHIRIGSGGVMLPHYSSYSVAENFRLLQALHPNRIDVGIGNSAGTQIVQEAINEHKKRRAGYFTSIKDLQHYLTADSQDDFRFNELEARPMVDESPEMWLLSTSVKNAKMAGRLGLGYCYGFFPFASGDKLEIAEDAVRVYRKEFVPSDAMPEPKVMFSLFAAIGETEEEAEALGKSVDLWMLGQDNFARFEQIPSVETAAGYVPSAKEKQMMENNRSRIIVSSRDSIKDKLDALSDTIQADEILLCTIMPGIENRKRALSILSDVYGLADPME